MAIIETWLNQDINEAVKVRYIDGNMFSMDNGGNRINVTVMDGDSPATLSGTVSANVIRSDGSTVAVTGTYSGNTASVVLPQSCYVIPGVISIVVKITDSTTVTTIAAVVANVYQSTTDTVVDPGTVIPSIETLIAQINAAVASIPADYSDLWASIAPNYAYLSFPVGTGYLCTYNGHLYRAKGDIASSEAWTADHWSQINIGDYLFEMKSALNHSIDIAGANLLAISDFDTPTDSNVSYSVSGSKITITNSSTATYAGLLTSSAFLAKISAGRRYRFHARCSVSSGNGTPIIAAKAGNNYVNPIFIGVNGGAVVDFEVNSNTSAIALMVAWGASTSGAVVSFDELWVKEMGQDAVARADISDLKSALDLTTDMVLELNSEDIALTTDVQGYINSANKWTVSSTRLSYIIDIPLNALNLYVFTLPNHGTYIAFLKNNTITDGSAVQYATGSTRTNITANKEQKFSIPSDAKYLWVSKSFDGSNTEPKEVLWQIHNSMPLVDDTLTKAGEAADAKTVGNLFHEEIDFSSETSYEGIINVSNKWSVTNNRHCYLLEVPANAKKITVITGAAHGTYVAFLKSNTITDGSAADYATGSTRTNVTPNQKQDFNIPSDGAYLYIAKDFDGSDTTPETVLWIMHDGIPFVDKTLSQTGEAADAKETGDRIKGLGKSLTADQKIEVCSSNVILKYIDPDTKTISSLDPPSARLLVIPLEQVFSISVSIDVSSTKRIGFSNSTDYNADIYDYQQITGTLDTTVYNNGYKYLLIQLFVNSDAEQDVEDYIAETSITVRTSNLKKFYHSQNLHGLPILDSFSDISITTAAYADCAAFHALVKDLCDSSNGYITQTLLGQDNHENNLYKYVTHPKAWKYSVARQEYAPIIPIEGGKTVDTLTLLITSNIHGRERNGNWVMYNLLQKIMTENTDMIRFFRERVRIVWIPYICATGEYKNADDININRDFPTEKTGTCVSPEATLVKGVIDEYGEEIFMHLDLHTFNANSSYAAAYAGWIFTDSEKLAERSTIAANDVLLRYAEKYPSITRFDYDYIGSINTPTTCTYYTQKVYGAPSATIEGVLTMAGSPSGADSHTSATAYFYDMITQTICAMID